LCGCDPTKKGDLLKIFNTYPKFFWDFPHLNSIEYGRPYVKKKHQHIQQKKKFLFKIKYNNFKKIEKGGFYYQLK
jgi:hypothetical protein